jgi:hypothetical protein
MLKATAWPYPVHEELRYALGSVSYGNVVFNPTESSKGLVVDCASLRDHSEGTIIMRVSIQTPSLEVRQHVLAQPDSVSVTSGVRVLCKESKFRRFFRADPNGSVVAELPLRQLRGIAQADILFLADEDTLAANHVAITAGSIIATAPRPVILTLDEDWAGETIPVDWLDFESRQLPNNAFIHVELSGGSQVPRVWLNSRFRAQTEAVLLRAGGNSPAALAGAALRQLFWQQVWEKVLPWALKEESAEEENWPATRIAKMWRENFAEHNFPLPAPDNLDAQAFNELSMHLQHCLLAAQNLARVHGLLRFQPEARGNQ